MEFRLAELENPARQHGIRLGRVATRQNSVNELKRASIVMRAESYRRRLFSEFDQAKEMFLPWMIRSPLDFLVVARCLRKQSDDPVLKAVIRQNQIRVWAHLNGTDSTSVIQSDAVIALTKIGEDGHADGDEGYRGRTPP
jgi:hypothetical protein